MTTSAGSSGVWGRIVGQERAVDALRRAAERPVHAYLLVGARGSGVEDAARCFAAALVAPDDERSADLAMRGMHPDIVEFEPEGQTYKIEEVRQRVIPESARSPVEGSRKVIALYEADRLQGARGDAANALLKTLEEPPPRTVMMLITSSPDELPETVRSRCQRVDLAPLSAALIRETLERDGLAADDAALVASLAGGQLGRARALAGPMAEVRHAFVSAAGLLDGRAGRAVQAAESLAEMLKRTLVTMEARQEAEAEALATELEAAGYPDRSRSALLNRLAERHRREHRAARRRALGEGIAALETVYRDALAGSGSPVRNLDRAPLAIEPSAAGAALEACRAAREALERNPNEGLLLERLLVHLPAAGAEASPAAAPNGS